MDDSSAATVPRDKPGEIITSGKISSAVWYLAWPTIINTTMYMAYLTIDRLFLGSLPNSDASQAAAGIGGSVLSAQFALGSGLSVGAAALISRFLGAQNQRDAEEAARQALMLGAAVGIVAAAAMVAFAGPLVRLIGAKGEVVPLAKGYLEIVGTASIPMFMSSVVTSALRSAGAVRSLLCVGVITVGLNVLLDWALITGPGSLPSLGVEGAAIATVVTRLAALVTLIAFLRRSVLSGATRGLTPQFLWFKRIFNIGWPAAMPGLLWASSFAAYIKLTQYLPNTASIQAALTVGMTIESLCVIPGYAYNAAVAPLVGQNLGAGKIKRAEHCAWVAAGHAAAIMSVVALAFIVIPQRLAAPFTDKAVVASLIVAYLRTVAVRQPFLAAGMVFIGALQGAGETRMPMIIEFVVNWPVRLGLAWLLAIHLGYGATGMWISMAAPSFLYGLLLMACFKSGSWKTRQI